jgi:hypothetical protein
MPQVNTRADFSGSDIGRSTTVLAGEMSDDDIRQMLLMTDMNIYPLAGELGIMRTQTVAGEPRLGFLGAVATLEPPTNARHSAASFLAAMRAAFAARQVAEIDKHGQVDKARTGVHSVVRGKRPGDVLSTSRRLGRESEQAAVAGLLRALIFDVVSGCRVLSPASVRNGAARTRDARGDIIDYGLSLDYLPVTSHLFPGAGTASVSGWLAGARPVSSSGDADRALLARAMTPGAAVTVSEALDALEIAVVLVYRGRKWLAAVK